MHTLERCGAFTVKMQFGNATVTQGSGNSGSRVSLNPHSSVPAMSQDQSNSHQLAWAKPAEDTGNGGEAEGCETPPTHLHAWALSGPLLLEGRPRGPTD